MRAPPYSSRPDELFDAACFEDPFPLYARLRELCPIARIGETGVHLVASWDAIEEALRREQDFSANLTGVLIRGDDGRPGVFALPDSGASRVIATADEPDHAVHRGLVRPRLAAGLVAELESAVRGWVREALAPWLGSGGGDFVPIAELIPARVVARVLGLPEEDAGRHRQWAMMGGDMLAGDVGPAQLGHFAAETLELVRYLGSHLETARRQPQEGADAPLLHALARGVEAGAIDVEQAIGIAVVMFGAGGESTAALIGNAVRRLAHAPELAERLRGEPTLVPRFVEEVVRLEPPFKFHYRAVRRACELAGAALEPGDRLMLLWASANRDASRFEEPDAIRLDRRHPKQHMSFGRGPHFCVGAPLARLEARIVCEELLAGAPELHLDEGAPPVHARSIFVRRLERLALRARAVA